MRHNFVAAVLAAACMFFSSVAFAGDRVSVWPKGKMPHPQAHQIAAMADEAGQKGFRPEKHRTAYLEWYDTPAAEVRNGACMILISGGGYNNCCDVKCVAEWAEKLTALGFQCVNFVYRTPRPEGLSKHTTAWEDLQRTIRIVRSEAASRGLDPDRIGIMGSSAGGHLTLMGVTSSLHRSYLAKDEIDKLSCSVQWGIGIYPAYALTDGIDNHNTGGGNEDDAVLVPEFSFDLKTVPMLFIHGDADGWAAMNSVKCWEKMRAMGIQSELHTLAKRAHCFQRTCSPGTGSYTHLDRIWEFLTAKGYNR